MDLDLRKAKYNDYKRIYNQINGNKIRNLDIYPAKNFNKILKFNEITSFVYPLLDFEEQLGIPRVDLNNYFIAPMVLTSIPEKLARKHHPDMPGGDHEKFQEINAAHKLIQKELM